MKNNVITKNFGKNFDSRVIYQVSQEGNVTNVI